MSEVEPKGILLGGWLDGRLIGETDQPELRAIGPGIIPASGMVFLSSGGETLEGKIELVRYRRTDELNGDGFVIYQHIE